MKTFPEANGMPFQRSRPVKKPLETSQVILVRMHSTESITSTSFVTERPVHILPPT